MLPPGTWADAVDAIASVSADQHRVLDKVRDMSPPRWCTHAPAWLHQPDPGGQTSGNKGFLPLRDARIDLRQTGLDQRALHAGREQVVVLLRLAGVAAAAR